MTKTHILPVFKRKRKKNTQNKLYFKRADGYFLCSIAEVKSGAHDETDEAEN